MDAGYLADALLAPLAANLVAYRLREHGVDLERVCLALDQLVAGIDDEPEPSASQ